MCNLQLSAYAYINGQHNCNKVPLAPPGTKVVIHRKPTQRKSWDFHGQLGWYVGPAPEHYRCYCCYIPSTGKEIITDTVNFLPTKVPFPQENFQERFVRTMTKLTKLMPPTTRAPLHLVLQQSTDIEQALPYNAHLRIIKRNATTIIKKQNPHKSKNSKM